MNIEDLNKPLQKTLNILKDGFKTDKDLLYLFSSYVASNPNFKYNTTYLTDSIDHFLMDLELYSKKKTYFDEVIQYLQELNKSKFEIEILFDSKFRFNTIESDNLEVVKDTIIYNNSYDFHLIGSKDFSMKLILVKPIKIEYSYIIKIDSKPNLQWKKMISNFMNIIEKQKHEEKQFI
jgi:hypothetical protein